MHIRLLLDEELTPDNDRLVRAMLEFTAEAPAAADARPPLNLALVLDRSGSMSGEKLAAARRAAAGLVRRLGPKDVVGVVAYDDQVTTIAEPATGASQPDLAQRIEQIHAGGSTNLSAGWLRGRQMVDGVRARTPDARVNRVILMTDGLANVGITEPSQLTGLAAGAQRGGVTTTTIGFGANFDEALLRAMADAGGGATYYIETADQALDVFAEELEGLLAIAAQNVRVTVRAASRRASPPLVRHAFPSSASADGGLVCELGDLYAREPKRLLVQTLVSLPEEDDAFEVLVLDVSADVIEADGSIAHRAWHFPVTISRSGGLRADPEVKREALLLDAAEARRAALEAERRGDVDGARLRLRETSGRILAEAAPSDSELREQAEDLSGMADRLDTIGRFDSADAKYMAQREYDVMRSRRALTERTSRVRRERRPEA